MNRTQYRQARRLLRADGLYALRFMDRDTRAEMEDVVDAKQAIDPLEARAGLIAFCRRTDSTCSRAAA